MSDVAAPPGARSKESQSKGWRKVYDKASRLIRERPFDHLSAILVELRELDLSRKDPNAFYRKRDLVRPLGERILAKAGATLDQTTLHPNVIGGRYLAAPISPIRYLLNCVRPDTCAIVEFGSGWGANLLQLFVAIGATRARAITFHAAEFTEPGRLCADLLARRDPHLRLQSHAFDYRAPNIDFLSGATGHVLAFTRHSVEQVDMIDPALYDRLHALGAATTLVHLEPVGWQADPDLMRRRLAGDAAFFREIGENFLDRLDTPAQQRANAAWWSWRLNYNVNLLQTIRSCADRGLVRLEREIPDIDAIGNVLNPTSIYHVEFAK